MEQLIQLKEMLASARARLEKNPDYKLVNSLENLIDDLETAFGPIDDVVEQPEPETVAEQVEEEASPVAEFQAEETADTISEVPEIVAESVVVEEIEPYVAAETEVVDVNPLDVAADQSADALASKLEDALNEMVEPEIVSATTEPEFQDAVEDETNPYSATGLSSTNGTGIPVN